MFLTTKILALASVFSTLSSAAPKVARNACNNPKVFVDQFDNITVNAVLPEANAVSFYGGLQYSAFDAATAQLLGLGVIPASSPNIIAASVNQDLTKLGAVTLNPFGILSTNGTKTKSFSLVEFFYACLVASNGVPVPAGCTLEVYGYDIYGSRRGSVTYSYAPSNELSTPMSRAVLPITYALLQNVTFAISSGDAVPAATTVLYLDNVTHINCY